MNLTPCQISSPCPSRFRATFEIRSSSNSFGTCVYVCVCVCVCVRRVVLSYVSVSVCRLSLSLHKVFVSLREVMRTESRILVCTTPGAIAPTRI